MKKVVYYEGQKYHITFESYGYDSSRFIVNGETSSLYLSDKGLLKLDNFKDFAIESIKEYINRHKAEEAFRNWDGKL